MAQFKAFPYQLVEPNGWNGLTRETHLINAFGDEPQYLDKVVRNIYSVNYGMTFDEFLNRFPVEYVSEDKFFKWKLRGREERNIPLLAAWEDESGTAPIGSTNPRPGINGTRFYLDFPEKYFGVTEVIKGRKDNYHFRIMKEPHQVSTNRYRYEVQLVTGDDDFFVPITELQAGMRFAKSYGYVERYLSKDGFDISFTTPFDMQNRISMLRMQHLVPGEMIDKGKNKPLAFGFVKEDGTVVKAWLPYLEYKFIADFKRAKNRMIFYGKTTLREDGTSTMKGTSGNVIEAGLGIREQFATSNKIYYSTLAFERLVNTLLELSIGRKDMGDRNFIIGTGEYGLKMLHELVANHLSANDYRWLNDATGRGFSWSDNDIQVKFGQFRGFATINGIKVSFMHIDHYDDPIYNIIQHPNGGPAESYRLTIMDVGTKNDPNIHKIRIKGFEPQYAYIPGIRDPFNRGGLGRMKAVASKVDGYEMMLMDKEGAVVRDPTRIVEFIPSILAG